MVTQVVGQADELCPGLQLPVFHALECGHVFVVHTYDIVETLKVIFADLAGTMVEVVTTQGSALAHAAVGQLPLMPGADAGGVYFEEMFHVVYFQQVAHYALCCRRAADVAEADKEYFLLHGCKGNEKFRIKDFE